MESNLKLTGSENSEKEQVKKEAFADKLESFLSDIQIQLETINAITVGLEEYNWKSNKVCDSRGAAYFISNRILEDIQKFYQTDFSEFLKSN